MTAKDDKVREAARLAALMAPTPVHRHRFAKETIDAHNDVCAVCGLPARNRVHYLPSGYVPPAVDVQALRTGDRNA